jgi:excinuclease ABC subunit C
LRHTVHPGAHAGRSSSTRWESLAFDPADANAALAALPQSSAVFALYGADAHAEPYIGRTPDLRARLERLLQPSPRHPRRLQLAGMVRRIEWQLTGSDFESLLAQFDLLQNVYGTKGPNQAPNQATDRMHLRHPSFVRFLGGNPYPRVTVTHRPSQREAGWAYGPFASRAAAERYAEEMLKLFLLRRCTFDLNPDPGYPGCVYSEMKMCLAPCYKGCSDERYTEESAAVESFLATRGDSRLVSLRLQRDQASANLEFESAAALHAQLQRVEAVRALAPEIVRPLSRLRAVILQASPHPDQVAVFLFEDGSLRGPVSFSTLGMRIQNEQSGSTSLFAQPLAIEAAPEAQEIRDQRSEIEQSHNVQEESGHDFSRAVELPKNEGALAPEPSPAPTKIPRTLLESRLEAVLAELSAPSGPPSAAIRQGHLALLKRWYYRPETRRAGEIIFPDADDRWPIRAILRAVGRVAAKAISPGQ